MWNDSLVRRMQHETCEERARGMDRVVGSCVGQSRSQSDYHGGRCNMRVWDTERRVPFAKKSQYTLPSAWLADTKPVTSFSFGMVCNANSSCAAAAGMRNSKRCIWATTHGVQKVAASVEIEHRAWQSAATQRPLSAAVSHCYRQCGSATPRRRATLVAGADRRGPQHALWRSTWLGGDTHADAQDALVAHCGSQTVSNASAATSRALPKSPSTAARPAHGYYPHPIPLTQPSGRRVQQADASDVRRNV
jgi:hypothetical protein